MGAFLLSATLHLSMPSIGGWLGRLFDPHLEKPKQLYGGVAIMAVAVAVMFLWLSPLKIIGLVLAVLAVTATMRWPQWALLALCAYVPFEPFVLKYVPDDIYVFARYGSEGLIYVLVAAVIWQTWRSRRVDKVVHTPLDVPFLLLLVVALASVVINWVSPVIGVLGIRQIIRFVLLFFVVVYLRPKVEYAKLLTMVMVGVLLVQVGVGLAQRLTGGALDGFLTPTERRFTDTLQLTTGTIQTWDPGTRVSAFMGRYEQLGTFMAFFLLLAVGFIYSLKDKEERQRVGWLLLVSLPTLVFTESRSSWVGLLLGVLLIGGILMRDKRVWAVFGMGIAALGIFVAANRAIVSFVVDLPDQTTAERVLEIFSYERWRGEYDGLGRLFWIVQTPLVVVPSSPIFGVGPGQYGGGAAVALHNTTVYDKLGLPFGVFGEEGFIDNNWLSLWGEIGTLGVSLYLWMIIMLLVMAIQTWRRESDDWVRGLALGYAGCVVLVSFVALLGNYFEIRTLAMYLWVFGGLVWVLGRSDLMSGKAEER